MSAKAGPNGHALASFSKDMVSLPSCLLSKLFNIAGHVFQDKVINLLEFLENDTKSQGLTEGKYRKLVDFPDTEDKVRVVAELDYFSQSALKPLHSYLFKILSKIENDFTFDQSKFTNVLPNIPPNAIFHSIDLSAATDRFPIDAIACVLRGFLPN